MASIGSRVKELRMKKGLTQAELGSLSGIHHTNIGRIENKDAIPQADVLYMIAKNLDTSMEWLLTGLTPFPVDEPLLPFYPANDKNKHSDSLLQEFYSLYQKLTETEKLEVIRFVKFIIHQKITDPT